MTQGQLVGKVALVTGAGRGIGRATAIALAAEGAAVALAARTLAELHSVQKEIEASGGEATVFPTDMAEEAQIQTTLQGVIDTYERLDILVNNAGVSARYPVAELPTSDYDRVMAVNARGPFILSRDAIPHLLKNTPSFIVNIISVGARRCYVNTGVYSASKHALRALSIVLSQELKDTGIRVHAINPGGVETEMMASQMATRADLQGAKMVKPKEIADIVLYLVTHGDGGIIDEVSIRRADSPYYCYP